MVRKTKLLLLLQEYSLTAAFNWQFTILLEAEKLFFKANDYKSSQISQPG